MSKPKKDQHCICMACGKIDTEDTIYNSSLHDDERFQMLVTTTGINPTFCFSCYDELLEITARLYRLFGDNTEEMITFLSRSDIIGCLETKMCL